MSRDVLTLGRYLRHLSQLLRSPGSPGQVPGHEEMLTVVSEVLGEGGWSSRMFDDDDVLRGPCPATAFPGRRAHESPATVDATLTYHRDLAPALLLANSNLTMLLLHVCINVYQCVSGTN